MNNSKIIGSNTGEHWVGLLDDTYVIIITLLVIELPDLIVELINFIEEGISAATVTSVIETHILGYLF
tara:strand:+ start:286 stop:489 length:204 start_codon:yes stop_codon:yes gene_type:complete